MTQRYFLTAVLIDQPSEFLGATRGSIELERLSQNKFKILKISYNYEQCFGKYACYDSELMDKTNIFINDVLNFENVCLLNNKDIQRRAR